MRFRASKGDPGDDDKDEMLDLVNRVQMFRIAIKKINNKLTISGRTPVFKLADENTKQNLNYDIYK